MPKSASEASEAGLRLLRVLSRPIYYPSSFLKLIIAGFLMVSLPLIFAIVNNAVAIHDIVERSHVQGIRDPAGATAVHAARSRRG